MKILVTASTGKIGRKIVPELLAPEFSVRVIVRDPVRLPDEIREQVEVVRGSTDDAAALCQALDGVESLFWCVPTESFQETNVRGHYERFAHAASQAIRKTGTPRVVTVSAIGKGLARKAGPFSGLHAMEDILNESGAAIRHLRCSFFMENFLLQARSICEQGFISYPMPRHIPIPMAAVADISDAALKWLVRRDWKGIASSAVHGPEDLSFSQTAAVLERILERPVQYRQTPANDYARILFGSGASTKYARCPVEMFAELAQGIARAEPRTAASTTPTTFAAWAQSELLPAVASLRPQLETKAAHAQSLNERVYPDGYHKFSRSEYEYGTQKT